MIELTKLEQLEAELFVANDAVRNALRVKVAAESAFDTASTAFLDAEKLCIKAEKTFYKSDVLLDKAQLALSNFLKEQQGNE